MTSSQARKDAVDMLVRSVVGMTKQAKVRMSDKTRNECPPVACFCEPECESGIEHSKRQIKAGKVILDAARDGGLPIPRRVLGL